MRVLQLAAALIVLGRLARGRRRRDTLVAPDQAPRATVSVVVPARDEEQRLGPCLSGLAGDPDLLEVLVVDDESTDRTAELARGHGARVVEGLPLPSGWAGKAWALEQGLRAARGDFVLFLDADTRPRPGLARALLAALGPAALLSAAPRFVCRSAGERLLHPALLATLVYRFGPTDVDGFEPSPGSATANGQCMLAERERLTAGGGWGQVRANLIEDVALARALRRRGEHVAFVDASGLLEVEMYDGVRETWSGWGRSLALTEVTAPPRLALDLACVWLCQAAPALRLATGHGGPLDWLLLAVRLALQAGLARSYRPRGVAFWLAPLADVPAAVRLSLSAARPNRTWRGRTYPA